MKRAVRLRKLVVGFAAAAVALLVALSGFSAYEVLRHADDRAWVEHSDIVVDLLQESRYQVVIAELARQTFLNARTASSRDDVRRASEALRSNAEALQTLMADAPERAARAEELATLSAAIRSSVETPAHRGSPREGAPAFARAEALTRTMEAEERALQAERDKRERHSGDKALTLLAAELLIALTLAGAALRLILRGIAERERLLFEAQRPQSLLQNVLDHVPASVSLIDLEGRVIFANKEYARIIGASPAAAAGRPLSELLPASDAAAILAEVAAVHAAGAPMGLERPFVGADGPRVYLTRRVPIPAEGLRPAAVCSINTDVTSLKEYEQTLVAANAELDAFSYSAAHDLRAPLRAMDGFARELEDAHAGALAGEPLLLVGRVRARVRRMSRLIDELLSFSRLERLAPRSEDVDMTALARRAAADAAEAEPGRDVRLEIGDLPPCRGDAPMLALVWDNLVSNAYKFTRPRNPPRIEIGGALRDGAVEYWVKDDGVGFDPSRAGRLFSAFSRLHDGTKFEGTGVGLALVRRVVERHGGGVSVEGSVDGGAVFRFTLPRPKNA